MTIDFIDEIYKDKEFKDYIDSFFKETEEIKKVILRDFFKHVFDRSGDDGGFCIDDRSLME